MSANRRQKTGARGPAVAANSVLSDIKSISKQKQGHVRARSALSGGSMGGGSMGGGSMDRGATRSTPSDNVRKRKELTTIIKTRVLNKECDNMQDFMRQLRETCPQNEMMAELYDSMSVKLDEQKGLSSLQQDALVFQMFFDAYVLPDVDIVTASPLSFTCTCGQTQRCYLEIYNAFVALGGPDVALRWLCHRVPQEARRHGSEVKALVEIHQLCVMLLWYSEWVLSKHISRLCVSSLVYNTTFLASNWWKRDMLAVAVDAMLMDNHLRMSQRSKDFGVPSHKALYPRCICRILLHLLIDGCKNYSLHAMPQAVKAFTDPHVIPLFMRVLTRSHVSTSKQCIEHFNFMLLRHPDNNGTVLSDPTWVNWFVPVTVGHLVGDEFTHLFEDEEVFQQHDASGKTRLAPKFLAMELDDSSDEEEEAIDDDHEHLNDEQSAQKREGIIQLSINAVITILFHSLTHRIKPPKMSHKRAGKKKATTNIFVLLDSLLDAFDVNGGWNSVTVTIFKIIVNGVITKLGKQVNHFHSKMDHVVWDGLFPMLDFFECFFLFTPLPEDAFMGQNMGDEGGEGNELMPTLLDGRFCVLGLHATPRGEAADLGVIKKVQTLVKALYSNMEETNEDLDQQNFDKNQKQTFREYFQTTEATLEALKELVKYCQNAAKLSPADLETDEYKDKVKAYAGLLHTRRGKVAKRMAKHGIDLATPGSKKLRRDLVSAVSVMRSKRLQNKKKEESTNMSRRQTRSERIIASVSRIQDNKLRQPEMSVPATVAEGKTTADNADPDAPGSSSETMKKTTVKTFRLKDVLSQAIRKIPEFWGKAKKETEVLPPPEKDTAAAAAADGDAAEDAARGTSEDVKAQAPTVATDESEEEEEEEEESPRCFSCLVRFQDSNEDMFERNGNLYCQQDFLKHFCTCAKCGELLGSEEDTQEKQTFAIYVTVVDEMGSEREVTMNLHKECYCCAECGKAFDPTAKVHATLEEEDEGACFHDGKLYCRADYLRKFAKVCHHCDEYIAGAVKYIPETGRYYHMEHFKCGFCSDQLDGGYYFFKSEAPAAGGDDAAPPEPLNIACCNSCYQQALKRVCSACGELIVDDQCIQVEKRGLQFHASCFCCSVESCRLHKKKDNTRIKQVLSDVQQRDKEQERKHAEAAVRAEELARTGAFMRCRYKYAATTDDQLSFDKGAIILVVEEESDIPGWSRGVLVKSEEFPVPGQVGYFAGNYVKKCDGCPEGVQLPATPAVVDALEANSSDIEVVSAAADADEDEPRAPSSSSTEPESFLVGEGEDENLYCRMHYAEKYAPKCAYCALPIDLSDTTNECLTILDKFTAHKKCTKCSVCHVQLSDKIYTSTAMLPSGAPALFCHRDFLLRYAPRCAVCDLPFDKGVQVKGRRIHDACLACHICHVDLKGKPIFIDDVATEPSEKKVEEEDGKEDDDDDLSVLETVTREKPVLLYCREDYKALLMARQVAAAPKCPQCSKAVIGQFARLPTRPDLRYHRECLVCFTPECKNQLSVEDIKHPDEENHLFCLIHRQDEAAIEARRVPEQPKPAPTPMPTPTPVPTPTTTPTVASPISPTGVRKVVLSKRSLSKSSRRIVRKPLLKKAAVPFPPPSASSSASSASSASLASIAPLSSASVAVSVPSPALPTNAPLPVHSMFASPFADAPKSIPSAPAPQTSLEKNGHVYSAPRVSQAASANAADAIQSVVASERSRIVSMVAKFEAREGGDGLQAEASSSSSGSSNVSDSKTAAVAPEPTATGRVYNAPRLSQAANPGVADALKTIQLSDRDRVVSIVAQTDAIEQTPAVAVAVTVNGGEASDSDCEAVEDGEDTRIMMRAKYPFKGENEGEGQLSKGELVEVKEQTNEGWTMIESASGGWVPTSYLEGGI